MKPNLYYFNKSIENPELLEERYMSLGWNEHIDDYVVKTKKIKELLATIKTLRKRDENADRIYIDLQNALADQYSDKNELNAFLNACDSTVATVKNNLPILKQVVNLYLDYRDFTEQTPKEWVQAIIDKGNSRSLGIIGEKKLVELAEGAGFTEVANPESFESTDYAVVRFSKQNFNNLRLQSMLNSEWNFNIQNKMLDVILKNKDKYILIEAKHLKESGGSQDKQINELIRIIQDENQKGTVYYGAFLDGVYSNTLIGGIKLSNQYLESLKSISDRSKLVSQRIDILEALNKTRNFWLNTAGYIELVQDFKNL
jgi:hypothetical protein